MPFFIPLIPIAVGAAELVAGAVVVALGSVLPGCAEEAEEDDSSDAVPDQIVRYNPTPPDQPPPTIQDALPYITDLKCTSSMAMLTPSHFAKNILYGHCTGPLGKSANVPYASGEETLVAIDTLLDPPAISYRDLYPDIGPIPHTSLEPVNHFKYLREIGPDLFAGAQLAFTAVARPDELLVFDLQGPDDVQTTEISLTPITLPSGSADTRGRAVTETPLDNVRDMVFHPESNTLFVATTNLVCDAECSWEGSYFNPGTITAVAVTEDRGLEQSTSMVTSAYKPTRLTLGGRARDQLVVLNEGGHVEAMAMDIFDVNTGERIQTLKQTDLEGEEGVSIEGIGDIMDTSPDGASLFFFTQGIGDEGFSAYLNVLDMDSHHVTTIKENVHAVAQPPIVLDQLLVGNGARLYLTDWVYGFTEVLDYDLQTADLDLRGMIVQNPTCVQYAPDEGYHGTIGGPGCKGWAGAALLYEGYLWRSVGNRIVRSPLDQ